MTKRKSGTGRGATGRRRRSNAWRAFQSERIKLAVQEEVKRNLAVDLPEVVDRIRRLSKGDAVADGKREPTARDALQANQFLASQGGLHPMAEVKVTVEKTEVEKLRELRSLVEQGVTPASLIEGITLTDVEYQEIGPLLPAPSPAQEGAGRPRALPPVILPSIVSGA